MTAFANQQVTFIGSGVMAEAMIKGLIKDNLLQPDQIVAADPRPERGADLVARYGLRYEPDNGAAARDANVLVLSIKPQALPDVTPILRRTSHGASLVLSILAGARIRTIADGLANANVVRAMPNTPAQIGQGITVWTAAPDVTDAAKAQARALLGALGDELYVTDEKYLDMATALSGTGPAYVFMFMEALIDAGVHMGFSRIDAERLVLQTMRGSVQYAMQSEMHMAQLRNQVTSPGGTSASAIYEMERGGLRTVIADSVWAAFNKSKALGDAQEKGDK